MLDIGGGPGRYSLYLAERGCNVTLFDFSEGNTKFAEKQDEIRNLNIKTICGDACVADEILCEKYDHILLMGPMYHLIEETDRIRAMSSA